MMPTAPPAPSDPGIRPDLDVLIVGAGISGISEGMLKIKVTAPPVEGAANEACIDLLAKSLKLRKSQMKISTGAKGRKKTILVSEIGKTDLVRKIQQLETGHTSSLILLKR